MRMAPPSKRRRAPVVVAYVTFAFCGAAMAQPMNHAHHAVHLGAGVMPFDIARSVHVFKATNDGGSMEVVSRDGDAAQISLIRRHLQREAAAFAKGDYSDPAAIHGAAMPGLDELETGADRIRVQFTPTRRGANLRFSSDDPRLVAAIHAWFAAQTHDHGPDAVTRP
jgi:hypothetical protein